MVYTFVDRSWCGDCLSLYLFNQHPGPPGRYSVQVHDAYRRLMELLKWNYLQNFVCQSISANEYNASLFIYISISLVRLLCCLFSFFRSNSNMCEPPNNLCLSCKIENASDVVLVICYVSKYSHRIWCGWCGWCCFGNAIPFHTRIFE